MRAISRRDMLKSALAGALYPLASLRAEESSRRPNLLYIFPDEWRQQALGFMKCDPVQTPNLDAFASESVVFTNAVSNIPICSPHRAMLLTGQYPASNGVPGNCNTGSPSMFLRPDARTISDVLAGSGYACGYIGKYHLDTPTEEDAKYGEGPRGKKGKGGGGLVWDAYTPPNRRHGFSFWHAYGCCDKHFTPHYWVGDAPVSQPLQVNQWSPEHEADVAEAYIRNTDNKMRDPSKPFALFVANNPPHMPFNQVPDEYKALYADKAPESLLVRKNVSTQDNGTRITNGAAAPKSVQDYFAMITGVDRQIGRLLRALQETGQAENTIVVFSSDHGEMMGSHNRMGKGVYYDESFLVPFIVRWPGKLKARREGLHFNTPDVMPTLLGLMGLTGRIPASVEGCDHSRLMLTGEGVRPRSTFFIGGMESANGGSRAVRTDRYTFVVDKGGSQGVVLHDRQADPWQLDNCAAAHPEVCRELTEEMDRWLKKTRDPWGGIKWPIVFHDSVSVVQDGDAFRVTAGQAAWNAGSRIPVGKECRVEPDGKGASRLRASSMDGGSEFHEYLRIPGLLKPETSYTLNYTYTLHGAGPKGELYHVVRSPTSQHRSLREYWRPEEGKPCAVNVRFTTGRDADEQLILGLHHQADVSIGTIDVRPVK